jgi:hypothetical protein
MNGLRGISGGEVEDQQSGAIARIGRKRRVLTISSRQTVD